MANGYKTHQVVAEGSFLSISWYVAKNKRKGGYQLFTVIDLRSADVTFKEYAKGIAEEVHRQLQSQRLNLRPSFVEKQSEVMMNGVTVFVLATLNPA